MSIRVLVVDDHAVVRQGLRMYLGLDPTMEVVGEAASGSEAVACAREQRPDIVLMDLLMPGGSGLDATAAIRAELPETAVVAVTSALEEDLVVRAMQAGATGYVLKGVGAEELCAVIRGAALGQVQLSPEAARLFIRPVPRAEAPADDVPEPLSGRERQVLGLLAGGLSNKEIARLLEVGEQTVKTYVSRLCAKLGVQSRTQAAIRASQLGLLGAHAPDA